VVLAVAAGLGRRHVAAQEASPVATPAAEAPSVLFVLIADGGSFRPMSDQAGTFELSLTGVAPQTVYFSDRPNRFAGMVRTEDFVAERVFDPADPPNAALVASTAAGDDVLIVSLANPRFDPTAGAVQFDATPLATYAGDGLAELAARQQDDTVAEEFGAASLFVDDVACSPDGSLCNDASQCCSGFCSPLAAFPPLTCLTP
jgi:hypothetical protein